MARVCIDPVIKCEAKDESKHSSEYKGEKVYFCSVECKEEFEKTLSTTWRKTFTQALDFSLTRKSHSVKQPQ
jgi:YHS domain-containing protein